MIKLRNSKGALVVLGQHLLAILAMVLVVAISIPSAFQGKEILHGDKVHSLAMKRDVQSYHEKYGELSNWTDRSYSGMPSTLIYPVYPNNLASKFINSLGMLTHPQVIQMLLPMLCLYIALVMSGYPIWLSLIGSIAFGITTINMGNVFASHSSKVKAIATALPLLIGANLVFNEKVLKGFFLVSVFGALHLATNHLQITYYSVLLGGIMALWYLVVLGKKQEWKRVFKGYLVVVLACLIALMPNVSMLWSNYDYMKETVRGKAILESDNHANNGLNRQSANMFNHNGLELVSTFIPRSVGGSNKERLGSDSELYKFVKKTGLQGSRLKGKTIEAPLFWGDKPMNEAPTYMGVVFLFLLAVALAVSENRMRLLILLLIAACSIIALGRNAGFLNELLLNHMPFYNKFRAPSMILGVLSGLLAWAIVHGMSRINANKDVLKLKAKPMILGAGVIGVLCLFFALAGPSFFDFTWSFGVEHAGVSMDESLKNQMLSAGNEAGLVEDFMMALYNDRASAMRSDSFRSLVFLLFAAGLLLAVFKTWINKTVFFIGISILMLADVVPVNKRYLDDDRFKKSVTYSELIPPSESDRTIDRLRAPSDRVLDLGGTVWQDARPSYYHHSVGGNHAAKLRRYQDLIDRHLGREVAQIKAGNKQVAVPGLNMLNVRYFRTGYDANSYMENVTSAGFAWFVDSIAWVDSAEEEIGLIKDLQRTDFAIVHEEFRDAVNISSGATGFSKIELTEKKPGLIIYSTTVEKESLMVLSEIWYRGNEYWRSYIDDEPVDHIRVNYALRGIVVPEGKHTIRFEYKSEAFEQAEPISAAGSAIWLITLGCGLFFLNRNKKGVA